MKFNYTALDTQGNEYVDRSILLSGFSYAIILSSVSLLSNRWMWETELNHSVTDAEWDEIDERVSKAIGEVQLNTLIGTVLPLMVESITEAYLLCDGGTYQRIDYPLLYEVLPSALKISADEFIVPDMADLAIVGASITHPILDTYGESEHTLTEAELAEHSHAETIVGTTLGLEGNIPALVATGASGTTGTTGADQPHNNIQPSIALYWCVVAK